MPHIYSPAANTIARVLIGGAVLGGAGGLLLLIGVQRSEWQTGEDVAVMQPIQFSHERHVAGNGLDCRYCHASVEVSSFAGYPPTQTCMNCHAQIFADSDYLEPVRASWRTGVPLIWRRVYNLPDHVYFDHSIHVAKGVGCATCHGRVDEMPLMRQAVPLLMEWCLGCHRNPEPYLRPRAEVFSMSYEPPSDQAALGAALAAEYGVRRLTDCYTCHR